MPLEPPLKTGIDLMSAAAVMFSSSADMMGAGVGEGTTAAETMIDGSDPDDDDADVEVVDGGVASDDRQEGSDTTTDAAEEVGTRRVCGTLPVKTSSAVGASGSMAARVWTGGNPPGTTDPPGDG